MSNVYVRRKGDILMPADNEALETILKIAEGQMVKCKISKKRSSPHHRLFFGAIKAAYDNWPEQHPEKFTDEEELRGWLLCKAGHCSQIKLELDRPDYASKAAEMFSFFIIKAFGKRTVFFKSYESFLIGYIPESIAQDVVDQTEFTVISQKVSDVLKAETNMSLDDFKQEQAA